MLMTCGHQMQMREEPYCVAGNDEKNVLIYSYIHYIIGRGGDEIEESC